MEAMGERADGKSEAERPGKAVARSERLACALRENLRKRKAQARARSVAAKPGDGHDAGG